MPKFKIIFSLLVLSLSSAFFPQIVYAERPITSAVVERVENRVRLTPRNQPARLARPQDQMNPGDALSTAAKSKADIRFNEGSFARLGEQAVFQFVQGTRNFNLSNGTALLLIAPGQGKTQVRTPNSAAGIRGSALFVRYIPETDTTIFGALTDSEITVFNQDASEGVILKAGQIAQIVQGKIENVYDFDVQTFLETSPLVKDLNLIQINPLLGANDPLNQVKEEVITTVESQSPFTDQENIIENPDFIRLSNNNSADGFPDANVTVVNLDISNIEPNNLREALISESSQNIINLTDLLEAGEIKATESLRDNNTGGNFPGGGATGGNFPGGGATGGNFPGGGATGGNFPGGGATGGNFPGGGATGGNFPGGGATGGNFPGGGATGGNFPGGGATGGNFPGGGATGGNFPGGGATGGNFPGGGATGGNFPGGGNSGNNGNNRN